ncbi:sugar phosphate nucleotidyltransferase [Roseivivax sp. CAU 1761]
MSYADRKDRSPEAAVGKRPSPETMDVLPVLLAGGQGSRLHELTSDLCKPAVPFLGDVRIVDFTMENLVESGFDRVVVATQYRAEPLEEHLHKVWRKKMRPAGMLIRNAVRISGRPDASRGTADALRLSLAEIDRIAPREVLVLAADHVYRMDYRPMIAAHRAAGARLTVAADMVPRAEASAFGVLAADDAGRVTAFVEKPANPPAAAGHPDSAFASMGIYVIDWAWLRALLSEREDVLDFGHDVVPVAVAAGSCRVHAPGEAAPFYWRDVGTLDALRLAALEFAAEVPPFPLPRSRARGSRGGWAEMSERLTCQDSLVMSGSMVSAGALLSNCIVAPGCVLPFGTVIGVDAAEDARWFRRTEQGTVLVTANMLQARNQARTGGVDPGSA